MKKTVGTPDRVARGVLAVAAVLGAWALGFASGWGVTLLVVAAIMVLTAASGYCPIYSLLRVGTVPRKGAEAVRPTHPNAPRAT